MRSLGRRVLVAAVAALAACASTGQTGAHVQHNVVTAEELSRTPTMNLYDALGRIRPSFFRSRDVQTTSHPIIEPVQVYLDGQRTEGLDALRQIMADAVQEVRFYEPQDANTRFGTGNNGGAMDVILKP